MDQQLYNTFSKLFPYDIINIILSYSENTIIIKLQNYFPKNLKHITINCKRIIDGSVQYLVHLVKLNCCNSNRIEIWRLDQYNKSIKPYDELELLL